MLVCAACREVWEFLSAWSELYGITADAGFLRSVSAKIQGANNSVRRHGQAFLIPPILLGPWTLDSYAHVHDCLDDHSCRLQ